jgi:hypothetical protein
MSTKQIKKAVEAKPVDVPEGLCAVFSARPAHGLLNYCLMIVDDEEQQTTSTQVSRSVCCP